MLCSCSFIIPTIHREFQMLAQGLYSGGLVFEVIFGFAYRGPIFGSAYIGGT